MSVDFKCFACMTYNANNYELKTPLNHGMNCALNFPITPTTGDESMYAETTSQNRAYSVSVKSVEQFDDESSILPTPSDDPMNSEPSFHTNFLDQLMVAARQG